MAKTKVQVNCEGDSIIHAIKAVTRALRNNSHEKLAAQFQIDIGSGDKKVFDVIKEYVIVI